MVTVLSPRRRAAALALALLFVTGACADDKSLDTDGVGGGITTGETTSSTFPPVSTDGGSATTSGGRGDPTPNDRGNPGARPATGSTVIRDTADEAPGAFAGVLLAPGAATSLVVDVLVQDGAAADPAALSALRDLLTQHSGKPVTVRGPTAINAADDVHSGDEIRALANQGRAQGSDTAVIHLLYLDGTYTDDGALGVAVRADTVAIFPDQLDRVASPFVSRSRIERAVATHELGHVLGLVDLYLDEGRDDPEHAGHSMNPRSVMYWAVESDLVGQVLGGPPPVAFDAADEADLRAIRGGASPG